MEKTTSWNDGLEISKKHSFPLSQGAAWLVLASWGPFYTKQCKSGTNISNLHSKLIWWPQVRCYTSQVLSKFQRTQISHVLAVPQNHLFIHESYTLRSTYVIQVMALKQGATVMLQKGDCGGGGKLRPLLLVSQANSHRRRQIPSTSTKNKQLLLVAVGREVLK